MTCLRHLRLNGNLALKRMDVHLELPWIFAGYVSQTGTHLYAAFFRPFVWELLVIYLALMFFRFANVYVIHLKKFH